MWRRDASINRSTVWRLRLRLRNWWAANYNVPMRSLTRRQWVAVTAAAPLVAQVDTKAPPNAPAPQSLDKAKADVQKVSQQLAELEVPMNVEPAFHFSAQ